MKGLAVLAATGFLAVIYAVVQRRAQNTEATKRRTQLFSEDSRDITLRSADNVRLLNEEQLENHEGDTDRS